MVHKGYSITKKHMSTIEEPKAEATEIDKHQMQQKKGGLRVMGLGVKAYLSALALRVVQTHGLPTILTYFMRMRGDCRRGRWVMSSGIRERGKGIESTHWSARVS